MAATLPLCDYPALDRAPVATDPFPHILVPNFIPPDTLSTIYADLPQLDRGGSFPPESLPLGPQAKALMAELQTPRLRNAIAEKFDLDLDQAPAMTTIRLYCREKDGQIHTDSNAKRVTILLYLNPAKAAFDQQEGCLRLLRTPLDLENFAVEIPPTNGTLLIFPNAENAWHGHRIYVGPRHSVQLNYMTADRKARTELRRHRLSALLKRLWH